MQPVIGRSGRGETYERRKKTGAAAFRGTSENAFSSDKRAVDDVSFSVRQGMTLGIVGESGCGKTTTGKCILQILKPTEGRVVYQGVDLLTASKAKRAEYRRDIQMIFQDPFGSLDPRQTAYAIVD